MNAVIIDDQREIGGKPLENVEFARLRHTGVFGSAVPTRRPARSACLPGNPDRSDHFAVAIL